MDLHDIRKWFDSEVDRLQSRLDAGDYTRAQFDHDIMALKAERDLKMGGMEDEVAEGGGGLKDLDEDGTMLPDGSKISNTGICSSNQSFILQHLSCRTSKRIPS
jgi:hypothetical protein